MADLTVIILTRDEILHIERCITNAFKVASHVIVVDSGSNDGTPDIASSLGARVVTHAWVNHATQLNWALENLDIRTTWVMRMDADEYMDQALIASLKTGLSNAHAEIAGFTVKRYVVFQGKKIRHGGGVSPGTVLRVWRLGLAKCENRWMDEHILLKGKSLSLKGALFDHNLNSLSWWIQKHNAYASREAVELLNLEYGFVKTETRSEQLQGAARIKRALKNRIYARLPVGVRASMYFVYRTVFCLGFMDGPSGMAFHFMQALWYRMLVDLKVREVESAMKNYDEDVVNAIRRVLDIDVRPQAGT